MNQGRIEVRFDLRCTVIRRAKTRMGVTSWANEVSLSLSLSRKCAKQPRHWPGVLACLQTKPKKENVRAQMKLSRLVMFMQQGYTGAWVVRMQQCLAWTCMGPTD